MQIWRSKGTQCLLCSFRPLIRQVERQFATTSLRRSKKSQKSRQNIRIDSSGKVSRKHGPDSISSQKIVEGRAFQSIVQSALYDIKRRLTPEDPLLSSWQRFESIMLVASGLSSTSDKFKRSSLSRVKVSLQNAYVNSGLKGLHRKLQSSLEAEHINSQLSPSQLDQQKKVADLRYPAEWFPQARSIQRTIHLHVGPTNSGKTYHALKRLQTSKKGFYGGPLRLLAQEVYHRFKEKGLPCGLVTGDEVQIPENGGSPSIVSNTVEMVDLGNDYDVGVIDEIQMIADRHRGWAWTRAVLGARTPELHLCGELRAVPLIRELAALTGDSLEIHRYERLNPLKVMDTSLDGDLSKLRKGDCIVAFSRIGIHALKSHIEKMTGRRAAIVYGGLPAEIRTQQARLFNDPANDYDFLVASDAIGMGLNLRIKRVIFESLVKKTPLGLFQLTVSEIKQIAGRAGRFFADTEESDVGLVTSLEAVDLPHIQHAMSVEPPPLRAAGIMPPNSVIQRFSAYYPPNVPFSYLMQRLIDTSNVEPPFFLCDPQNQLENSEVIDAVSGLRIEDKMTLMAAPAHLRSQGGKRAALAFARCISDHSDGRLLDIPELNLEILEDPVSGSKDYLNDLEVLHKSLILYLWLSYRVGGIFTDRALASHVKELVEERMMRTLVEFSANKHLRRDASLRRQIALQKQYQHQRVLLEEAGLSDSFESDTNTIALSGTDESVPATTAEAQTT